MTETKTEAKKADSKTGFLKRAVHEGVTLPSGAVVSIRIPNIAQLITAGTIPNELVEAAIKQTNAAESDEPTPIDKEQIEQSWEYLKIVIPLTLVEPKVTADEVESISTLDLDMLASFAARRIDTDAVGHQLGGLETQAAFREARGIVSLDEILSRIDEGGEETP